mgnify:CR=1 FL=1
MINTRLLGALSAALLIVGSIKFPGHEAFTVLGLVTLLYIFRKLGLVGRLNDAKIALIIMITVVAFNYVAAAILLGLYGIIKVTVSPYSVVMYLSPNMPLWLRYPSNQVALVYAFIGAAWPLIIAYSYYLYHAVDGLGRLHRYAGIALMLGAVLYIAIIGAIIMTASYILLLIAWLMPNINLRDKGPSNFTKIHAIRVVAWSIIISLIILLIVPLFVALNPQYSGLDPVTGLVFSSKHPIEYMALLNYSLVDIGITNKTYVPNSITILGFISVVPQPYYIRVEVMTNSCSDLITVAPESTSKTTYSIPYQMPPTPLNPFGTESQVVYQGTAVKTIIRTNEVLWIYIPALSVSDHVPVPNGFLLTCTLNNHNYVFPVNITITAIVNTRGNYFITSYNMVYTKVLFMINRTTIRLINEGNGSFVISSINYVNIAPIIYLPLFIYYIVHDREFYKKLLNFEGLN